MKHWMCENWLFSDNRNTTAEPLWRRSEEKGSHTESRPQLKCFTVLWIFFRTPTKTMSYPHNRSGPEGENVFIKLFVWMFYKYFSNGLTSRLVYLTKLVRVRKKFLITHPSDLRGALKRCGMRHRKLRMYYNHFRMDLDWIRTTEEIW